MLQQKEAVLLGSNHGDPAWGPNIEGLTQDFFGKCLDLKWGGPIQGATFRGKMDGASLF